MNVSIILPFYHKLKEFKNALPYNKEFFVEGMELVLPIDEPESEYELKKFLDNQKLSIPYIIRSNKIVHDWRNPAKTINVGIKLSSKSKLIIMSPETICVGNLYKNLYDGCSSGSFAVGRVCFSNIKEFLSEEKIMIEKLFEKKDKENPAAYYGSMCVYKQDVEKIQGYNESFKLWGGDDDDIRQRLEKSGLKKVEILQAKALHVHAVNLRKLTERPEGWSNLNIPFTDQPEWGTDF